MPPWYDGRESCYDGIDHDDCSGCQCPCHDDDEHDPDQCQDPGCDC